MKSPRRVVVVGASLAGLNALQAARQNGYDGALILVGDEPHLPYDRPPLSKALLDRDPQLENDPPVPHLPGAHTLQAELGVELRLGHRATALDGARKTITVDGDAIGYDALIIATGAHARRLPQQPLPNVFTLRTLDDARALRAALDSAKNVVVIGAGFIGSEVASAARKRGLAVTILESLPTPLGRVLGDEAGAALTALHRRRGTQVECGVQIERLEGGERVTAIQLRDGRSFSADVVVVGIGAQPATAWLEGSGLTLDDGIVCDEKLFTGVDSVWAAGDVARWPNSATGRTARVEHWTNAIDQGIHAMTNALAVEQASAFRSVPYFWSDWYDSVIQFAGVASGPARVVAGGWGDESFTAIYGAGDAFAGVLSLNRRADIMKFRNLLNRGASMAQALALAESRRSAAQS